VEIDNRKIGKGEIGDMTRELQRIYFNAVRGNMEKYKHWLTPVYEN